MKGDIITLIFLLISNLNYVTSSEEYDYGFVIDAGSTGSRIYAYQWKRRISVISSNSVIDPESRPVEIGDSLKVGPISDVTSLDSARELLVPMIEHVKQITIEQESRWSEFPIYLKATAGMRLLDNEVRVDIFDWVREVFNDEAINPFLFKDSYAIIASGTEEATFDWLSVNFLLSILQDDDEDKTYGALDLGGASTQIAFTPQPSSDIIDSFTYLEPFNYPFRLYAVSHLGYGTIELERRIAAKVYSEGTDKNPCLLTGTTKIYEYIRCNGEFVYNVHQIGTSDAELCEEYIKAELYLDQPICDIFDFGDECSLNGVYIPHLPDDMEWVAFSSFGYTIAEMSHGIHDRSTIAEIYDVAKNQLCAYTLDEIKDVIPDAYSIDTMCLLSLYIVVLLRDGYHFDVNKQNILWTNSINGQNAGWQWGSILYDANLLDPTFLCNMTDTADQDQSSASSSSESADSQSMSAESQYVHLAAPDIASNAENYSMTHLILSFIVGVMITLFLFIGFIIGNKTSGAQNVKFQQSDV